MTNPFPYSITDILLDPRRCDSILKRNIAIAQVLESKADEFYQCFGIHLVFFVDPLAGFNYCRFIDTVLEPISNGTSPNKATARRFGVRAAALIGELINAGSGR